MDQQYQPPPLLFGGNPPPFNNTQHVQPQLQPQQPPRLQQQAPIPTGTQIILVLDGSACGKSAKSVLIGDDENGVLQRFVQNTLSEQKNIDYCMVVYRGYPSGSDLSVECSQITSDFKHFIRWLDLVKFEGGGRRNHALTEGLYYASQFCDPRIQNYVIVFTGSEYSNLSCVIDTDYNACKILTEMSQSKNARVSLVCTRKIESLRQLWFESIGESLLQVVEENQQLWLLWGLEADVPLTKTFKWYLTIDATRPKQQLQFQASLQMPTKVESKNWPAVFEIQKYGPNNDLSESVKEKLVSVQLNKVKNEDNHYDYFVKFLQARQFFAHLECNPATGEGMIIYVRQDNPPGLVGLLFNKPKHQQQPQQSQQRVTPSNPQYLYNKTS